MLDVPDEAARAALVDILSHAYNDKPDDTRLWFRASGEQNLRVLRRSSDVVAGCLLIPMGQFFGGRAVPMTGIAGVGVRLDQQRLGFAADLMSQVVRELAEARVALSSLYASTLSLYRKVGYEAAGSRFVAEILPRDIEVRESALSTDMYTPAHRAELEAFYERFAGSTPGFLSRGAYIWDRLVGVRFGVPAYGVLLRDENGGLEGYVFYRKHPGTGGLQRVEVTDMMGSTPRALRRAWSFLRDLSTVVGSLAVNTSPTDPAYLIHPNPQFQMRLLENWMMRVAHVPVALESRGYPAHLRLEVEFAVQDEVVPNNQGPWRLVLRDGQGTVERGGEGGVRLDVGALSALYSGMMDTAALVRLGRMNGDPEALQRFSLAFAGPAPWMREMF